MTTFGSNGTFAIWNHSTKSKYHESPIFELPIQAGDVSDDASLIAFSLGYDWSQGSESNLKTKPVSLFIRVPEEKEIRGRSGY